MSSTISPQVTYAAILGRVLQGYREAAGKNQAELATALGISQPAYSKIEQGGTTASVLQLRGIAIALGVNPGAIMADVENWIVRLNSQGVTVVSNKDIPKAALLVGLGMLAGLIAIGSAAST